MDAETLAAAIEAGREDREYWDRVDAERDADAEREEDW